MLKINYKIGYKIYSSYVYRIYRKVSLPSSFFFSFKLIILLAFVLEVLQALKMLFFRQNVVVELFLAPHMVISEVLNLFLGLLYVLLDCSKCRCYIVLQQLLLFLGFAASVRSVDFGQVLLLFVEQHLRLLNGVVKVAMAPDFFSLLVQVIK